ncbi:allophanate hydrolase [Tistlia consotensis]|uniref:Allophanate hydrolase n=1 Tax=Tistlia consotensis USBA 355 TaxID=560819 RepID=A0A1Y6CH43_9PROT|nr:allophanate hydrolase [Tistlia consotensis]SMF55535.1 allophanate hydrolase [Tistlia consotensis USBA 355]SNR88627.1 allophanate hydrolase [Tistlia consotensis]
MPDLPLNLASLRAAYAAGVSPAEVVAAVYRRIEALGDPGIFIHLRPEAELLAEAAALPPFQAAGGLPLWGVPFAIKDNIDLAGAPTTAACPAYAYEPAADAFCVARLRRAGALAIGKTNLDQFATGLVGVRSPFPPPLNALDPAMAPGGSSSGSAVAVAQGLVTFALGTDTAGSGRVPAALNNIVGLKPSLGLISNGGVVPACRSLDTVSLFALTVEDAWRALAVAAGYDPADPWSRRLPLRGPAAPAGRFRVGVPAPASRRFFGDAVQAGSFAAGLERIAALGGELVELDFEPFYEVAALLYDGPWVAERYTVVEPLLQSDPEALHPVTRQVIAKAEGFSAADTFRASYRLAGLKRRIEPLLDGLDLLCVPTIPGFCSLAELAADPIGPNSRLGTYTNFVNLLDLCGIAVPIAPRADGRPGSLTLLARAGRDHLAAGLAARLHAEAGVTAGVTGGATGWPLSPAEPPAAVAAEDEIALAVVGAHMTGLPLNGDLTRLGARFLSRTRTAPCYRLYALPGGPPFKPGLVRSEQGGAIEIEVWALPESAFGAFMRTVPQPLGIGTLSLEDGSQVKGFLCEPVAVEGARDITGFGGWRAYLAEAASPAAAAP